MLSVMKYSQLYGKISAMRSKMLTEEDYDQMMRKVYVSEIALYLKENTYYSSDFKDLQGDRIRRGYLENTLHRSEIEDAIKITKHLKGEDREFFRYVFRKQEIEDLKMMLRTLQMGKKLSTLDPMTLFISKFSKINFDETLKANSIGELVESLIHTKFYTILKPLMINNYKIDLFSAEMALDMYYYIRLVERLEKHAKATEKLILKEIFGTNADLKNILLIYRMKKYYNVNKQMIYRYIIPLSYKLKKDDLNALIEAENDETFFQVLKGTYYQDCVTENVENWEAEVMMYNVRVQKRVMIRYPFSMSPVVGYMTLKNLEISNIITIIEGVRYKVSTDEIHQKLILP